MTLLLIALFAAFLVTYARAALRGLRIEELQRAMQSADAQAREQASEWRAKADRLNDDLARSAFVRLALESTLDRANERASHHSRDAVVERQRAHAAQARAERAESALKAIARVVSVPAEHPDVADKIMERLSALRGQTGSLQDTAGRSRNLDRTR